MFEMDERLKHIMCGQPLTLLLSPCPQRSGGGRASGARPGAAEEEVCQTAEREVCDAVILSTCSPKTLGHLFERTWVKTEPRMGQSCLVRLRWGFKSAVRGQLTQRGYF